MDKIIRSITADGGIMASAVDSTNIVITAQQVHGLSKTACAALGRLLTGASLMGAMLKSDQASLTLKVDGGGPLGTLAAVSDAGGNVRGYVDHPELELPVRADGKIDVGGGVGRDGRLAVLRDFGGREPYIGQVELVSGEIAEDLTAYYAQSEQIPTVCALGVLADKGSGAALLAGGMLIQALPGADDESLTRLEENIRSMDSVTTMLAKGLSPEEMCRVALEGFEMEILDEFPINYVCTCSRERVSRLLLSLGSKELYDMAEEKGEAEVRCQFCGKKYLIEKDELLALAGAAAEKEAAGRANAEST